MYDVRQFMKATRKQRVPLHPEVPDEATRRLRVNLIAEELREFARDSGFFCRTNVEGVSEQVEAGEPDIIKAADDLADLLYVVYGAAIAWGIPVQRVFAAVHEANMRKFGPGSYEREDGKWMKPPDWQPPDIERALYGSDQVRTASE